MIGFAQQFMNRSADELALRRNRIPIGKVRLKRSATIHLPRLQTPQQSPGMTSDPLHQPTNVRNKLGYCHLVNQAPIFSIGLLKQKLR